MRHHLMLVVMHANDVEPGGRTRPGCLRADGANREGCPGHARPRGVDHPGEWSTPRSGSTICTDLAYPTVHREGARLLNAGILSERQMGRTSLIRANDESPLVSPCARSSRSRPVRW